MNSQVKIALVPYDELRKRQEDETATSKSYSDVLTSDLQNSIKVRILNDIVNKFLERKLQSESFLESLFEPKDIPQKVQKVPLKTRKRVVRKRKSFTSKASSPITDVAQIPQSDLPTQNTEVESIVEERPQKKRSMKRVLFTPIVKSRKRMPQKMKEQAHWTPFTKVMFNTIKDDVVIDKTGKIYDSTGRWIKDSNIEDVFESITNASDENVPGKEYIKNLLKEKNLPIAEPEKRKNQVVLRKGRLTWLS